MANSKGFTLVELIVAMGIFVVIMAMAGYGFERVIATTGQQSRSAQSNFEGVVGLEMLRYDIEHAGYGVAWTFQNYSSEIKFRNLGGTTDHELIADANAPLDGFDSTTLNATRAKNIQPFAAGTATKEVNHTAVTNAAGGPDYLVIRSTVSSLDDSARKWSYVNYSADSSSNLSYMKHWDNGDNLSSNDRIITVLSTFTTDGKEKKILLQDGADNFELNLTGTGAMPAGDAFKPASPADIVVAYGIRSAAASALRMPYNRTDYYVTRPDSGMPTNCNPGTGILYKDMVSHATGGFETPYPLMDCIGDMQVDFEYDPNDDGIVTHLPPALLTAKTAEEMRLHLKNIRIYILTHEGKMDKSYRYPGDSIHVGDPNKASSGRTLTSSEMSTLFSSNWRNYRWKIYTMVIRPKNLAQ
ncbi:Type IV fimbrial biogenesis protein PilW [Citrifermentans bremense]|uniref:Type IV fimbrial biogenesis protein PilW n=1 Tax=Citrifermentans bremense TaxID=60035 RepID=A0A6S6M8U2_9BACT|nr:prepilin-type N-terminal cleavage/methylation domain-containing protein [Citrifermentans bremense]BCG47855.1 Type IV fimbrial biogenesis protein PilW [Citrifermentans bremense]